MYSSPRNDVRYSRNGGSAVALAVVARPDLVADSLRVLLLPVALVLVLGLIIGSGG
jgi:hypothetical protein